MTRTELVFSGGCAIAILALGYILINGRWRIRRQIDDPVLQIIATQQWHTLAATFGVVVWLVTIIALGNSSVSEHPAYSITIIGLFFLILFWAGLSARRATDYLIDVPDEARIRSIWSYLVVGGVALGLLSIFATVTHEPLAYTFGGEQYKTYKPVDAVLCVGEPIRFPMTFSVRADDERWVRIEWARTWHREDALGLIGWTDIQGWDYDQPFTHDFGVIPITPPERVGVGRWRVVGHGTVNGASSSGGYRVTVTYIECDD